MKKLVTKTETDAPKIGKSVRKIEMGDPHARKLMKKVETSDSKVAELVKEVQINDPKSWKRLEFGKIWTREVQEARAGCDVGRSW